MKRKLCALLLSSAMVLAALTGCGAKSESASTPAPEESAPVSAQETQQAPQAPAAEASAEEASAVEAAPQEEGISKYVTPDNIEERIAGRPSVELPIADDDTTFTFWTGSPAMDATITGWNDSTAVQELEKRTGVHIDYIEVAPPAQSESLNLMFASGDFPDILNYAITGTYSIPYLIENEIVMDLQDMMEEHAPSYTALMDADPALYLATVDDEGQIGGLAGYRYNSFTTTGAIVRSDWVEKVGMKTSELTTIDDYHDFLAAVKAQGLCEYPMPLRYDSSITGSPFLAAMGGYMGPAAESSPQSFYYDDNDELVYSFITDTYKGKVGDPDYALAGISEPLVEEGQTVGHGDITTIAINLMVCTSCDDPETALEWLDYHFSEDGSILCQYGIEGEGLEYKDGKPNYSDLISNNPDGLSTDNALNAYAINMNMFASNGTTLRAAYDEVQQEALNAWNDKREVTKSSFTNLFTLDADETATVQRYYADISTYVAEQVGKFLIGEADIDENWDTFVETVESMGIDEVIDAYTTAGERYFGRLD